MASTQGTQTIHAGRQLDHIYDPLYTLSSQSDRAKANHIVRTDVLPNYPNMFSSGRNYPATTVRMRQAGGSLPNVAANTASDLGDRPADVGGSDRWKYFRRPLVPFLSNFIYLRKEPNVQQQRARTTVAERAASPLTKTVAVQTLYRESEAQTDPYSPDYILPAGLTTQPEILALATLTYGQGLPVGPSELEMIERARAKRQWEATLPPASDAESFEKRLKMMEEMELKEWAYREAEIKRLQDARIEILKKVIKKREVEIQNVNRERMAKIWQKKLQEREALHEKIERKKAKILRKLADKRKNLENCFDRRDIIAEYADFGAKVFPKVRDGARNENIGHSLPRSSELLKDINLDVALQEMHVESAMASANITASLAKKDVYGSRKEQHLKEQLEYIEDRIRKQKERELAARQEAPLRYLIKVEKPVQRPPTPVANFCMPEEETKELAATRLQRLIRGRLAQNAMFQGKERRMDLINELRVRRALMSESNLASTKETQSLTDLHVPVAQDLKIEKLFETTIQAEYVGITLDFLSKELVRAREAKRILAMVKLAERTRKLRESDEAGTRKQELERRKREDEIFSQIMGIHEETVDSYLEEIILGSLDQTASEKARQQVQVQADQLSSAVASADEAANAETIVSDLMTSFLFPEIQRQEMRHRVRQGQQRYLAAAHRAIQEALPTIARQGSNNNNK